LVFRFAVNDITRAQFRCLQLITATKVMNSARLVQDTGCVINRS